MSASWPIRRPGESMVTFVATDAMRSSQIPDVWYNGTQKGRMTFDISCRNGVQGPFFNDEFGDTFGNIYVLTGKDFDYATHERICRPFTATIATRQRCCPRSIWSGCKIKKFGLKFPTPKPAQLGIPVTAIQQALQQQNTMASAGFFETDSDRIQVRVSGANYTVLMN